jgi:GntR family transcriptional repressor for pyruvate dehydrogenase complex
MGIRGVMMTNQAPSTKLYLQIVRELQNLIQTENIGPGEKLPSERELAERLQVGRSSVREALRSMELLGLIETKRGEGTFLTDYRKHQLVEVLSTFIMQEPKSFEDVHDTRKLHEKEAIRLVTGNKNLRDLPVWKSLIVKLQEEGTIEREDIIREIIISTNNRLSLKMWFLLKQYGLEPLSGYSTVEEKQVISSLLIAMIDGQIDAAITSYTDWSDWLSKGRDTQ